MLNAWQAYDPQKRSLIDQEAFVKQCTADGVAGDLVQLFHDLLAGAIYLWYVPLEKTHILLLSYKFLSYNKFSYISIKVLGSCFKAYM